jgi:hypothetical protein
MKKERPVFPTEYRSVPCPHPPDKKVLTNAFGHLLYPVFPFPVPGTEKGWDITIRPMKLQCDWHFRGVIGGQTGFILINP